MSVKSRMSSVQIKQIYLPADATLEVVYGNTIIGYLGTTGWVGNVVGNVTGNVTGNLTGSVAGNQVQSIAEFANDGAITAKQGIVLLSKGSAGAYTIAAPTATTDDGKIITVVSITAYAHVITSATDGFNAKGSSGTATWGAVIGNAAQFLAHQGHWYAIMKNGVTIA